MSFLLSVDCLIKHTKNFGGSQIIFLNIGQFGHFLV
jgi:hypothetical protein